MSLMRKNKYARFKYNIDKEFDAGVVLTGKDVKTIKSGDFEIRDAFLKLEKGELFVWNIIFANSTEKVQKRKLLLHKKEIQKIEELFRNKRNHGFVLNVRYNEKRLVKIAIGIGTIKKARDKKYSERRTTEKRNLEKDIKKGLY